MPEPIAPGHADAVNGDEFFEDNGLAALATEEAAAPVQTPPPRLGDPVPNFTGHQPFGPSGIAVVGVSEVKPPPSGDPFAGQKDARGVDWNPVKFRLKDGRPHIDTAGRFVPLGLGRFGKPAPAVDPFPRPFTAVSNGVSSLPADAPLPGEEPFVEITGEIATEVAIGLIQTALIMLGEEEGELTPLEAKMLRGPLLRCLAKYHLADKMTPELELGAIIATLVMRRLKKPKTQNWFLSRLAWLKSWWNARRLRRAVADPVAS